MSLPSPVPLSNTLFSFLFLANIPFTIMTLLSECDQRVSLWLLTGNLWEFVYRTSNNLSLLLSLKTEEKVTPSLTNYCLYINPQRYGSHKLSLLPKRVLIDLYIMQEMSCNYSFCEWRHATASSYLEVQKWACHSVGPPLSWTLTVFWSLLPCSLSLGRGTIDGLFETGYSIVIYPQNVDQFWVSVVTNDYCKKELFWPKLTATPFYKHKHKYAEGSWQAP